MDLKLVIGFIYGHYVVIFGTTLALFFTACMILLIRSIGGKSEDDHGAPADLNAIEGAMRRVLQSQPVSVIAGAKAVSDSAPSEIVVADGVSAAPAPTGAAGEDVAARDAKIAELQKELDGLRVSLSTGGGEDVAKAAMKEQIVGLTGKIDELQARLAEYEIIEDDIADLSMFKEENAVLKKEVERMKAQLASAPAAAAPASGPSGFEALEAEAAAATASASDAIAASPAVEAAAAVPDASLEATADAIPTAPAAAALSESAPPPELTDTPLSSQSEIDALLAGGGHTAVPDVAASGRSEAELGLDALLTAEAPQAADADVAETPVAAAAEDPLAGTPDPDKMLSEVETLAHSAQDEAGLDDTLDTEKLLAEVDSLKNGAKTA